MDGRYTAGRLVKCGQRGAAAGVGLGSSPTFVRAMFLGADAGVPRVIADVHPGVLLDAQYFDDDPTRLVQLRPRLKTDISPYRRKAMVGEMVLATRGVSPRFHCFVRPPRALRTNTPEAVEWCVSWLEQNQPAVGRHFRLLVNGTLPPGTFRN